MTRKVGSSRKAGTWQAISQSTGPISGTRNITRCPLKTRTATHVSPDPNSSTATPISIDSHDGNEARWPSNGLAVATTAKQAAIHSRLRSLRLSQ